MGEQTISKPMLKALEGVQECAGPDGWATKWPTLVTNAALIKCVKAGLLETVAKTVPGYGNLGWTAYRLTDKGERTLSTPEVRPEE